MVLFQPGLRIRIVKSGLLISKSLVLLTKGSSSSSGATAEDEEVRRPHIVLQDIWSTVDKWSSFGRKVSLSVEGFDEKVNHHFVPSLSAIQIFTLKPFTDDDPRSSATGIDDGTESGSAEPDSSDKRIVNADHLGYLYFQYNETDKPFKRQPLTPMINELATKHPGLTTLSSSELSPYSWISIAWYPIYPIPPNDNEDMSTAFLTYHSLMPNFPETNGKDVKGEEKGASGATKVELPPFAAVTYKAFGNVWIMPGTSDKQKIEMLEKSASSWLKSLGFFHNDFNFFMSRKFCGVPK
ncbi:PREDICTED: uncharacterized protein LOC104770700 [Camelina sativa]|uniref:Uncharacterized protein LOC104770700 n=1 Tax=Camelina sativa TaxID=90675 RepID=A0ABM0Y033_CAMSA|nr:PREDICTED: uncharacterized protein LOC104770700 [Camelina sativa]